MIRYSKPDIIIRVIYSLKTLDYIAAIVLFSNSTWISFLI